MDQQIKARCIYCGADVYYTGKEPLIKCGMCGHTLVIAKFENEIAQMNEALKEGEQAKRNLEEAREAKEKAEARLLDTIDSLDVIRDDQNVLSQLMRSVMAGQDSAENKLSQVKNISERILESHGDLFEGMSILGEIRGQLQKIGMDEAAGREYANAFIDWFRDIHDEDKALLEKTAAQLDLLLTRQKDLDDKIGRLARTADETQQKLDEFHSRWEETRLDEIRRLYHQAENDQYDRAYDKAYDKYEMIVTRGGADAEVLWRLLLCYYCVSYQPSDEGSPELIPIILNPDLTDPEDMTLRKDLSAELTTLPSDIKRVYEDELAKIDRILNKYRLIRDKVRYDVFISVKQQRNGNPTRDSFAAVTLYNKLTEKGLKVFNSRLTPPPAGQEYEPYIISALMSSRAMIVVGTCTENMEAQWVKNEWSRFQWLQKNEKKLTGKTRRVLLCYLADGMDPEEIPRGLNPNRQAIKADITADSHLDQALSFLLPVNEKTAPKGSTEKSRSSAEQTISQMTTWLYRKKFDKVMDAYESLNERGLYLDRAEVHLCALCAEKGVTSLDELADSGADLSQEPLFRLALKVSQGTEDYNALKRRLRKKGFVKNRLEGISGSGKTEPVLKSEEPGKKPQPANEDPDKKQKKTPVILICIGLAVVIFAAWLLSQGRRAKTPEAGETEAVVASVESESGIQDDSFGTAASETEEDYAINWKDENLEKAMRKITEIYGRPIMYSDVKDITKLDLSECSITDISSLSVMASLTELNLNENPIKDISSLSGLYNLKKLRLYKVTSDISSLAGLKNLEELYLMSNQITDISSLSGLTNLRELNLSYNQLTEVDSLAGLSDLEELDIDNNQITDISGLTGLQNLTELYLNGNQITDIRDLTDMPNLTRLDLRSNQITDISSLVDLPNLTELLLSHNPVTNVDVLENVTGLTQLWLAGITIEDTSFLRNLKALTDLDMSSDPGRGRITDISSLANLTDLESLDLYYNQITDISSLSGLTKLNHLSLHGNQITDISSLEGMTQMEFLWLEKNDITDISSLAGMVNMTVLNLGYTEVSDISVLAGLTNLRDLDLKHTKITDISSLAGLTNLETLNIGDNKITDYSPIDGLNIEHLYK